MAQKYLKIIKKLGKNRVRTNEPLASKTTFGIGGPADLYYEARTTGEIIKAVKLARQFKVPHFILGGGSNLLVSDEGWRGMVIKIKFSNFQIFKFSKIIVGAGVILGELVKKTAKLGLSGLEFAAGIPGTVGGAIRGNAGAWQQGIGERVLRVKVLSEDGRVKWLDCRECRFGYRQSRFKKNKEIILEVVLKLEKGDKNEIQKKVAEYLEKRRGQPKEPSAGCAFINPTVGPAGKLVEECGLKGKRIGDAQISPKHANFIVNLGKATAEEVLQLIRLAKREVKKRFGIKLEEEICLVGFDRVEGE